MSVRVGNYIIHHPHQGKVRVINVESGEAGDFDEGSLGAWIDKWFWEGF